MVTTRRSVYATPTIPVARGLRRERLARMQEAELNSQVLPPPPSSGQRPKPVDACQSTKQDKTPEADEVPPADPDSILQDDRCQGTQESMEATSCQSSQATIQPSGLPELPPSQYPPLGLREPPNASPPPASQEAPPNSSQYPPPGSQAEAPNSSQYPPPASQEPPSSQPPMAHQWFRPAPDVYQSSANPTVPIYHPVESLISFASGAPEPEPDTKPFANINRSQSSSDDDAEMNEFAMAANDPEGISAYAARKHEAITKAAIAVMAHMNGHGQGVERSEYLVILDGMLVDPEMQSRLPPILVERYEEAVKAQPATLQNRVLLDKFISATQKATTTIARIFLDGKNNGRALKQRRRARHARPREPAPAAEPFPLSQPSPAGPPAASAQPPPSSLPVPGSIRYPEPLTEANLSRAPDHSAKGKFKEHPGLWDEDRGVMRTSKGLRRPMPYPRRASSDSLRFAQAFAGPSAHPHNLDFHEESGYSVYSASTSLVHQQAEAKKQARSILDGKAAYDVQCFRNAQAILEETMRKKGPAMAASVERGFVLMRAYKMMMDINPPLLSEALLESISEASAPIASDRLTRQGTPRPSPDPLDRSHPSWNFFPSSSRGFPPPGPQKDL